MNNSNLSYSEILYLFADQFTTNKKSLAGMICLAAFLNLKDENLIRFEMKEEKKFVFFKGKAVMVEKLYSDKSDLVNKHFSDIEKIFLDHIINQKKVYDIVRSLLPEIDYTSPWGHILSIVQENLCQKGFVSKEKIKRWIFFTNEVYIVKEEKKAEVKEMFSQTRQSLSAFKNDIELYKETLKQIESAIESKWDRPIPDYD